MATDNPLPTVQRMFEAFGNRDLDRLLEIVIPIRAGHTLVRTRGPRKVSTSAVTAEGSFSRTFSET